MTQTTDWIEAIAEAPPELEPLFAPVRTLAGAGPKVEAALAKLLRCAPDQPPRLIDLLWHLPAGFTDRRFRPSIAEAQAGRITTLKITVKKHKPVPASTRAPYKVTCEDDSGVIDLVFFHADRRFLERLLPVGEERYISGAVERFGERVQMPHPDHILTQAQFEAMPDLEPVYPLGAGVTQKLVRRFTAQALDRIPEMRDWIDPRLKTVQGWPDFRAALDL
ncbi:MAG: ATP-dependent DNA helicase RecG, partial [Chitinophagales bacterium]|nr:ATP-dependent DNA helicase RecG [Hyphomicrobiales bacterium]